MAKFVTLAGVLLCLHYAALVKQTTAHCGYSNPRKLAAGEDGRNVSLTVNCRQEDAVLTWSNGGLPQLQEVTIFSSCIDPTNTSAGAVYSTPIYIFFGTNSDSDTKRATVEAFPGRRCSYYGCYEKQARARYYTFSTVSCAWTELGMTATIASTPQPTESSFYPLPSSNTLSDIRTSTGLSPSTSYLTPSSSSSSAAAKLLSPRSIPSPTPSVTSYYSTDTLLDEGKYSQNISLIASLSTLPPVVVSSTVLTISTTPHYPTGVSPPVYMWMVPVVVPLVLMIFIIIAVAALIATCYITTRKYENSLPIQKYAVYKGMSNIEEKIDPDFYPVNTCTPTDMISIHSDITVYIDGELNINQAEEDAGYDVIKQSNYNQDTTNQSLATNDSGHYVELSNTRLEATTSSQCVPVKSLLPTHHTTIDTEPNSATATTDTGKPRVSTQSDSVQETSLGYVLEEDMPAMKTTYHVDKSDSADSYEVQTWLEMRICKKEGSDSDR